MLSISALKGTPQIAPAGRGLRELLAQGERPDRATLVDWGCQLLEILTEAHARGVLYPQLTESDLVMLPEGRLIITRRGQRTLGPRHPTCSEPLGGGPCTPQDDLCAVGSLLRRLAFAGALRGGRGSLGTRDPLLKVLARATFADPAARYRSTGEMAEALREAGRSGAGGDAARRSDRPMASSGRVTPFPGATLRLLPAPAAGGPHRYLEDPDFFQALLVAVACLLLIGFVLAAGWLLLGRGGGFTWTGEPLAQSVAAPANPGPQCAGFSLPRQKKRPGWMTPPGLAALAFNGCQGNN
ncbi:MAG TPA: hypothetical protein VGX68_11300 [Thermoanaerobaculia bacterium]|jgi:hypothetical protein|nr:hypothetical protein [Thermoanaerobaculia bacterium]